MNRRVWTGILAGVVAATVLLGVAGTAYRAGQNHEVVTRVVGDGEVVRVVGGYGGYGYGYGYGGGFFLFQLFIILLVFLLFWPSAAAAAAGAVEDGAGPVGAAAGLGHPTDLYEAEAFVKRIDGSLAASIAATIVCLPLVRA